MKNNSESTEFSLTGWLREQVRSRLYDGDVIIAESKEHHPNANKWLLETVSGREGMQGLLEEYKQMRREINVERRWKHKRFEVHQIEQLLKNDAVIPKERKEYLQRDLEKKRRAIKKHYAQEEVYEK